MTAAVVLRKQQQGKVTKKKKCNIVYMAFWGLHVPWLALAGREAIPWLLARFSDFERSAHAPWSPAGTHTYTVVYRRDPCVPHSREHDGRPAAGKTKVLYQVFREKKIVLYVFNGNCSLPQQVQYKSKSTTAAFKGYFIPGIDKPRYNSRASSFSFRDSHETCFCMFTLQRAAARYTRSKKEKLKLLPLVETVLCCWLDGW